MKHLCQKIVLSNGLPVLFYPIDSIMSAFATLYVRTGAIFEKEKERGISHLIEHAALLGTEKYSSALHLSRATESLGAFSGAQTSQTFTEYSIRVPYINFREGLDLLHQLVFRPVLRKTDILKEKTVILSEFNDFWNDPENKFWHESHRKRFRQNEHPYSFRPMGKPETIRSLNLSRISDWRKKYYNPSNMILSLAGNFDGVNLSDLLKDVFGEETTGIKQDEPQFNPNDYSDFSFYHQEDKRPQISFSISFPVFGIKEVDRRERIRVKILNYIFGGARSSRIDRRLRDKEHLVYRCGCGLRLHSWMGCLDISGSTPREKLLRVMAAVKEEVEKLVDRGISEKELELAKKIISAWFMMLFDNPESTATFFGDQLFVDEEIWSPEKNLKEIEKVDKKEVERLARRIFDFSKININLLGDIPPKTLQDIKKMF